MLHLAAIDCDCCFDGAGSGADVYLNWPTHSWHYVAAKPNPTSNVIGCALPRMATSPPDYAHRRREKETSSRICAEVVSGT